MEMYPKFSLIRFDNRIMHIQNERAAKKSRYESGKHQNVRHIVNVKNANVRSDEHSACKRKMQVP